MDFKDRKILVVGFGKSGVSSARYLIGKGAKVTIGDIKPEDKLDKSLLDEVRHAGAALEAGEHRIETFLNSDMIIVSPGVPLNIRPLAEAAKAGIPVYGELEIASRMFDTPVLAVTGTNGKTTSVTLLGEIIKNAGLKLFEGGNIGTPLMDYAAKGAGADYVLVEVSSFQLDTMEEFSPAVSLILNITPDHLDRYESFDDYARSKFSIARNQGKGQYTVLNDDDPLLKNFHPDSGTEIIRYGIERAEGRNAWMEGKKLAVYMPGKADCSFNIEGFMLPGKHNISNLMGVVLVALCSGIDRKYIQETLSDFKGLHHRIEHVFSMKGVDFYDDSKATNVDAAVKSLETFERPVILVAGGIHKGGDYSPLVEASKSRVKKGIFIGEARFRLGEAFDSVIPYEYGKDMKDAVKRAFCAADKNDVVLLAPACSSFDMFTDYTHRGRVFREEAESLGNG